MYVFIYVCRSSFMCLFLEVVISLFRYFVRSFFSYCMRSVFLSSFIITLFRLWVLSFWLSVLHPPISLVTPMFVCFVFYVVISVVRPSFSLLVRSCLYLFRSLFRSLLRSFVLSFVRFIYFIRSSVVSFFMYLCI